MIPLKSEADLEGLRASAKILVRVMNKLRQLVAAGVTTAELDSVAQKLIAEENALAAFKGYNGYPASICVSVNEEIVHGIPGPRELKDGDILGLDLGINFKGYFTDAATTIPVGNIDPRVMKLLEITRKALAEGIRQAKEGNCLSDISASIQRCVEAAGFSVVRQFVGHGIGRKLHEEPEVPNFGRPHMGPQLKSGMVLAIEPMVNMGTWEAKVLDNGWTAVTCDGLPSAHFEHTVAITRGEPEILTKLYG